MDTKNKICALSVSLLLALGSALFGLEKGEAAARFANPDLDGKYVKGTDVIGKGWLLLDFFATDCEPCKEELPELEELHEQFGEKGLTFIVFATDSAGSSIVKPYFQANPTAAVVVLDRYKMAAGRYGVDEIPSLFLVNPEGIIVEKAIGYNPETIAEIRSLLSQELASGT